LLLQCLVECLDINVISRVIEEKEDDQEGIQRQHLDWLLQQTIST
jgi:hypothetical protein